MVGWGLPRHQRRAQQSLHQRLFSLNFQQADPVKMPLAVNDIDQVVYGLTTDLVQMMSLIAAQNKAIPKTSSLATQKEAISYRAGL